VAKDPAFLFYPGDYLRDTQCLSAEAQVAYDRIMCEHMRNICITQAQLNFFTKRLDKGDRDGLMTYLVKKEGGYQIEWVAESILKRRAYSKSRADNRSNTYVEHMENEIENENVKEYKYLKDKNFSEIYIHYISMRKTIRKPATDKAKKMALTLLHKHPITTAIQMLEQSVMNSWQGIFPLKQDKFNQPSSRRAAGEYKHFNEK